MLVPLEEARKRRDTRSLVSSVTLLYQKKKKKRIPNRRGLQYDVVKEAEKTKRWNKSGEEEGRNRRCIFHQKVLATGNHGSPASYEIHWNRCDFGPIQWCRNKSVYRDQVGGKLYLRWSIRGIVCVTPDQWLSIVAQRMRSRKVGRGNGKF